MRLIRKCDIGSSILMSETKYNPEDLDMDFIDKRYNIKADPSTVEGQIYSTPEGRQFINVGGRRVEVRNGDTRIPSRFFKLSVLKKRAKENNEFEISRREKREAERLELNREMLEFATEWYKERAKNPKYEDLLGGDKLLQVLDQVNSVKLLPGHYAVNDPNFEGDANVLTFDGLLTNEEDGYGKHGVYSVNRHGWKALNYVSKYRESDTPWHEAIGHGTYDNANLPWFKRILKRAPRVNGITDKQYDAYINSTENSERGAHVWGFRGANKDLLDSNGKKYIDPNRQLTGKDIEEMKTKEGFVMPNAFKNASSETIANLLNLFASNNTTYNNDLI